jgi:hypothetical protein
LKAKRADTCTICNVLNVIKEEKVQIEVLIQARNLTKDNGDIYITVYEGNKSGKGVITPCGYQHNKKTIDYLPLIKKVFPTASVTKNGIIHAKR